MSESPVRRLRHSGPALCTLLSVGLGLCAMPAVNAAATLEGDWRGGYRVDREVVPLTLRITAESGRLTAAATSPHDSVLAQTPAPVELRGDRARTRLRDRIALLELDGQLQGNVFAGTCSRLGRAGSFELRRAQPLDSAACERYSGVYRLADRELLEIQTSGAGDGTLFFSEPKSGRAGRLVPISATEFVAGPNLRDLFPIERRGSFRIGPAGVVTGLRWERDRESASEGIPVRVVTESLEIASGEARLAGTLTRPCSPGVYPAIVLVHGSGPATRAEFGTFPRMCAALGIACLAFDKRGSGSSTGRYHDFLTIDQLAEDVRAAIERLGERADIDRSRIGIAAWSQGGWVAARLAERAPPAFIVLVSSPTQSVAENGLFEIENEIRAAGLGEDAVAESRRLNLLFNRMILSGGGSWDTLRTELLRSRGAPWFARARLPDSLPPTAAPANLRWVERLRLYMDFEPASAWRRTQVPVLAFYGGQDRNVPGRQSADELRAMLASAGNTDVTIHFAPDADHWLWRVPESGRSAERRAKVEGLGAGIADWLVAHAHPSSSDCSPQDSQR